MAVGELARWTHGGMSEALGVQLRPDELLDLLPQQEPFRFVDEILAVDENSISARYTFRADADFYRGHFPGNPVTPGVILLESIAQVGVVALGIYLLALESGPDEVRKRVALFVDAEVEFSGVVRPGDAVEIHAERVFYRRGKLRSEAEMRLADGSLVCSALISGMGVAL